MKITLENTFHGTTAVVIPREVEPGRMGLSHRQVLRARRKLCGIRDCVCGGYAGERGSRVWVSLDHQDEWSAERNHYTLHDGRWGPFNDDYIDPEWTPERETPPPGHIGYEDIAS